MLTVYLISAFLLLAVAFVFFRIFGRRNYLRNGRLTPAYVFIQAFIWFIFGGFPYIYLSSDWPGVHVSLILRFIGNVSLWGGLFILFLAMAWLGLRRSLGEKADLLEQNGFYRVTRNPQIIACGMSVIGFTMLWPSWYALGWAIIFAVMAHMMVLTEEEHLRNSYGVEYRRYCERTPRYLGFPREP